LSSHALFQYQNCYAENNFRGDAFGGEGRIDFSRKMLLKNKKIHVIAAVIVKFVRTVF
jgi:hypothetical protein